MDDVLPLHRIEREDNLGPVTFVLMAQWIGGLKNSQMERRNQ